MSWNDRFAQPAYLFGKDPAPFVTRNAHLLDPGSSILVVADGEGRNSVWLAARGHSVTAFDYAPNAVGKARKLADETEVTLDLQVGDIMAWDWSARAYDAVFAAFIQFSPPEERRDVFAGLDAALRPGGLLFLHGFAPRQIGYGTGGPPFAQNMYTLDLLGEAFPGYAQLHVGDYDEPLASGSAHNGTAGLIDFIARKP